MRFIITAQSTATREPGAPQPEQAPGTEVFSAYMKFNEEMHNAGVLVASEGLNPAGKSAHVVIQNGKRVAKDGPFAETKELVGGFYLIEVASLEEAIRWAKRCPVGWGIDDVLEVRPLTAAADIPPEFLELAKAAAPNWSASFAKSR